MHRVKPISVVNIDSLIYNQIGLAKDISLHEMLKLYHEYKVVPQKKPIINSKEDYEKYIEEYKQIRMSKLIPFSLFIDKYFDKQSFWKLPPILEIVAPALFKEEMLTQES